MGLTSGFMKTEQQIIQGIERLLSASGLAGEMTSTITEWIKGENKPGEKQYPWAKFVFTVGNAFHATWDESLHGAVAMELYALAADIFDDIEDQDNNALPWRQVPAAQAINMASCLLLLSFKALGTMKNPGHYRLANAVFQEMGIAACEGQFQEFHDEKQITVTFDQYFDTIRKKSGALTAGACQLGAVLAGCSENMVHELGQFGEKLGMISQIKNDLQDFFRFETKSDFSQGKKTLPLVYLASVLKENSGEEWHDLCSLALRNRPEPDPEEKDRLRQLLIREGVVHYGSVICAWLTRQAVEILDTMEITKEQRGTLITLVEA